MRASEGFGEIDEWAPRAPLQCSLAITGAGLTLGRGTVLARMTQEAPPRLAVDGAEERILTLLSAALGKSVPLRLLDNLRRASEQWSRGDKCLAHIHLAFTGLPQIGEDGATRLVLADEALAKGASPRALLKALGLDSTPLDALKFNPDQPRVPAGSGRESGRWAPADGGSGSSARIIPVAEIEHQGEHPEGDPKDDVYEERRALGTETPEEDIQHGRPIDPLQTPTVPAVGPPSKSVLIGNNPGTRPRSDRYNTDLPGGLDQAKALFESLTKGQSINTEVTKDGTTRYFTFDNKIQLRINSDGAIRIDREIDLNGKTRETIHFGGDR